MNATSPEALYSLLAAALDDGKTELAVRMGYWGADGGTRVEDAMRQLREERELTETVPWVVNYYPGGENPGLVEFLLDPPEPEEGEFPEEGEPVLGEDGEALSGEAGEEPPGESGEAPPEGGLPDSASSGPEEPLEEGGKGEEGAEPAGPEEEGGGKN